MQDLEIKNNELFEFIKNVLLKYLPIVENRLDLMSNKKPEMDINIRLNPNNNTDLIFLFGNSSYKSNITEHTSLNSIIDVSEMFKVMDFLLSDHRVISSMNYLKEQNVLYFTFGINWCEEALKGINCGDIKLEIEFYNHLDLAKEWIIKIFDRYPKELETSSTYRQIKYDFFERFKQNEIDFMDRNQMIDMINTLSDEEIRKLLMTLDYHKFMKQNSQNNSKLIPKFQNKIL